MKNGLSVLGEGKDSEDEDEGGKGEDGPLLPGKFNFDRPVCNRVCELPVRRFADYPCA